MTLNEYLIDYATDETKATGEAVIEKQLDLIRNEKVKEASAKYIKQMEHGERDFRF